MMVGGLQLSCKGYILSWKPRRCSRFGIRLRAAGADAPNWEYWNEETASQGEGRDQKQMFEEIARRCRNLNINSNHWQEDLFRLFTWSCWLGCTCQTHNHADFWTLMVFQGLSSCSGEDWIFTGYGGVFDSATFEEFIWDKQMVCLVF